MRRWPTPTHWICAHGCHEQRHVKLVFGRQLLHKDWLCELHYENEMMGLSGSLVAVKSQSADSSLSIRTDHALCLDKHLSPSSRWRTKDDISKWMEHQNREIRHNVIFLYVLVLPPPQRTMKKIRSCQRTTTAYKPSKTNLRIFFFLFLLTRRSIAQVWKGFCLVWYYLF